MKKTVVRKGTTLMHRYHDREKHALYDFQTINVSSCVSFLLFVGFAFSAKKRPNSPRIFAEKCLLLSAATKRCSAENEIAQ